MRKLKIAQIAPLWFPIPPEKYGGTERIISYLTEGLIKKGHKVTLFAPGDSKTKSKLISVTKKGLISQKIPWNDWWWNNLNYSFAFERAKDFDIIHSHWTPLGMYFQRFVKTPVLHTFHNLPKKGDHRWSILAHYKKDSNVVFISKNQMKNSPIRFKRQWMVYNGINISQFKLNKKPGKHFIWIGRVCKDKGIENAVKVARKSGITILLAGQLQPKYEEYFEKKIKPYLGKKIKYIGELSQKQLSSFYGRAKAFIYPIEWQEPFGLCMAEAQACGTPIITFNKGSTKELVKNGKTGFVIPFFDKNKRKNIKGLQEAIKNIDKIKRQDCRKWVKENWTLEKMVNNYEKVYYQIINKEL